MNITRIVKTLMMAILLTVGSITILPRSASAIGDGPLIVAAMLKIQVAATAFVQGLMTSFIQKIVLKKLLGAGGTGIAEQEAAGAIGVQQALQQTSAVIVETANRQARIALNDAARRTFGAMGHVTIGGRSINIGSNAPSACKRIRDAELLTRAAPLVDRSVTEVTQTFTDYNSRFSSATGAVSGMAQDRAQHGDQVFALDWLQKLSVPNGETFEAAKRSIGYATYTTPLPAAPVGDSLAGKEYEMKRAAHSELVKLPQAVLARQLALSREIPNDARKRSYLSVMDGFGKTAVEDAINPSAMQVKTDAGVQREIALALNAMLAVNVERMRTEHETTALLAIMASKTLDERSQQLIKEHGAAVGAE